VDRYRVLVAVVFALSGLTSATRACEGRSSSELQRLGVEDRQAWLTPLSSDNASTRFHEETKRNLRVQQIEDLGGLCTFEDYLAAANIRSRGLAIADTLAAIRTSSVAQSLKPSSVEAKALFAHAIDRLAFVTQGKQLYGTLTDRTDGRVTVLPTVDGAVSDGDKAIAQSIPSSGFLAPPQPK
jgi:hypothetical protein